MTRCVGPASRVQDKLGTSDTAAEPMRRNSNRWLCFQDARSDRDIGGRSSGMTMRHEIDSKSLRWRVGCQLVCVAVSGLSLSMFARTVPIISSIICLDALSLRRHSIDDSLCRPGLQDARQDRDSGVSRSGLMMRHKIDRKSLRQHIGHLSCSLVLSMLARMMRDSFSNHLFRGPALEESIDR